MADIDPEDHVVRELDVYIANDLHAAATQLCLCQFPLRPPWRPYDMDSVSSVRFKNQAKRLEIDVPVQKDPANYNDEVEAFKQTDCTTLRSSKVDACTSYAVGVLSGDKMILAPVDYCLQLRPTMNHLQGAKAAPAAADDDDPDPDEPEELAAVEVQVKKRETERQQMARLNSYAYLSQKEDEEPWAKLNVHASGTAVSDNIWTNFVQPIEAPVGTPLDLPSYLACVIPQKPDPSAAASAATTADGASLHAAGAAAAPATDGGKASPEALAALPAALKELFDKTKVCSMANIRQFLSGSSDAAVKSVVPLTDRALHEAVVASGNVVCIRRVYIQQRTGKADLDRLRGVVIELLRDNESFRRGDVLEAAKAVKGLEVTDTLYNKVVKDLCFSRGNQWFMKPSADA